MQKGLYQYCYREMMKVCYRYTNDVETSAGIYNDAMIKIFNSISSYKEEGKLLGWIKRIVVNTCIDHVRIKALPEMKELNENYSGDAIIENSVLEKISAAEVRSILNRLPAKAALVFNLYVYEEYDHNEIATLLKIPTGSSRYYLSEARSMLKEMLTKNLHSINESIQ